MGCNDCVTDHEHCHEVLVLHTDGAVECATCGRGERSTHDWVQPCGEGCCDEALVAA